MPPDARRAANRIAIPRPSLASHDEVRRLPKLGFYWNLPSFQPRYTMQLTRAGS
jgi:hypothetical protein